MTPAEIETAARRRLNAVSDTFWSSAEIIDDCLYFACLEMARECRVIEDKPTAISSVASTATYNYPSNAIEIKRVTYANAPVDLVDPRKLDYMKGAATSTVSGTPRVYAVFEQVIELWPVPSVAGDSIQIWAYMQPARPVSTSSSTALDIPTQYHDALVIGTVYYMVTKEPSDPRIPMWKRAWDEHLAKIRSHAQRKKRAGGFNRVTLEEQLFNVS